MHIRIALAHVYPCTKFGVPRSKGVRARGQKAEDNKIAPWGHNFDPSGLILPMTRNSDQGAKRKSEKPVQCSRAVSVNPKLYEDGIDADVPQARIFAVGIPYLRQTMVLNNVTVSSDFENIVNLPRCYPMALLLWHYRFGIIALKWALKTHFSKYCNILQATRHYNITSYSITYYLRATYASPHVESSTTYRLEDASGAEPPPSAVTGAGAERELPADFSASAVTGRRGRRSREPELSQSPSRSLGHGDRREQQQETVFAGFFSVSFIVFIFLFWYLERCFDLSLSFCAEPFINNYLVSLFC